MKKITVFSLLYLSFFMLVSQRSVADRTDLPDYFYTLSSDIVENIKESSQNLNLRYADFMIIIENYDVLNSINLSNYYGEPFPIIDEWGTSVTHIVDSNTFYFLPVADTLYLQEDISTQKMFGKQLSIIPLNTNKDVHFKVSVATDESLTQNLTLEKYNGEDWYEDAQLVKIWQGISNYKELSDSAVYYFKVPPVEELTNIESLKTELSLRDTLVHYSGELSFDAEYVYKEKPCLYLIEGIIIKIEKYNQEKLIETKYIRTSILYGC